MSIQHQHAVTRSFNSERRPLSRSLAETVTRRMLRGLECGQLVVDSPAGERLAFEGKQPCPQTRLSIHSWRNIAAHYDLGNKFYEQWLDAGMTYSSGLFSSVDQTLEEAQDAKLDRVIDMLGLAGGDSA